MATVMLTATQTARLLGVHVSSLRRWCDAGTGPPFWRTPGGERRFSAEQVEEWLRAREASKAPRRE